MASNNDKQAKPESGDNRHHGNSFVYIGTIVLLVITVLAFVFVPAMGSMSNDDNSLTFGSWNGKPISFVQGGYFSTQVQQIKAQLESQGYKDTGDQFFAFQVWRRAFENTAVHLGLLDLSQKAGISVSDSYLDRQDDQRTRPSSRTASSPSASTAKRAIRSSCRSARKSRSRR